MSRWRLFTGRSTGSQTVTAGVVHGRRHVGELDEVAEVPDRGIAPPAVEVPHEGRAIDRGEDRGIAADLDAAFRVAGVLGEARRRGPDQGAAEAPGEADPFAGHVGAGLPPHRQRLQVVAELDADLLEHGIGIALDEGEGFLIQRLEDRDLAPDHGQEAEAAAPPCGPPGLGPAAPAPPTTGTPAAWGVGHRLASPLNCRRMMRGPDQPWYPDFDARCAISGAAHIDRAGIK